jgi:3-methyladenine DNA glycosylase AlkD
MITSLIRDIKEISTPAKAKTASRFFKTGPGEYSASDVFIGLTVPEQRLIAKKYQEISFDEIKKLLSHKIHEYRSVALLILVQKYENKKELRKKVFDFYLKNINQINNWDLVDLSAPNIVGDYLCKKSKASLYSLASSSNIWHRRIAIVSTFCFIKRNKFNDTLKISRILINDKEDLIHKATGWMLREVGKRNEDLLRNFIDKHVTFMPRTVLRYAIERFSAEDRQKYLKIK